MSLDVALEGEEITEACECLRCGNEHTKTYREELFSANITHNLNRMASEAGMYEHLWRPDEIGITTARELIEPIRKGLARMKADPDHFRPYSASNGWGTYDQFVPWIERYLAACEEYPDATIYVSR